MQWLRTRLFWLCWSRKMHQMDVERVIKVRDWRTVLIDRRGGQRVTLTFDLPWEA